MGNPWVYHIEIISAKTDLRIYLTPQTLSFGPHKEEGTKPSRQTSPNCPQVCSSAQFPIPDTTHLNFYPSALLLNLLICSCPLPAWSVPHVHSPRPLFCETLGPQGSALCLQLLSSWVCQYLIRPPVGTLNTDINPLPLPLPPVSRFNSLSPTVL